MNKQHIIQKLNTASYYHKAIHEQFDMLYEIFKSYNEKPLIDLRRKNTYKTSYRIGILHVSFSNLIKLFGLPHIISTEINDKVGMEWIFKCDKSFFTIYDYCVNLLYDNRGISFENIDSWSIGSDNSEVIIKIEEMIKDYNFIKLEK